MLYIGIHYSAIEHCWNYLSLCHYRKVELITSKERLDWLEHWQVSLGGEHYLFPEPHYFIDISILNLILLCDPSSSVLPFIHCCSGSPSLKAISESEGICQFAEGKTFSGQVKVQTLFTSLKLESNEIWISIKSHCPLLTPELNILSSISAMHVQQKCMLHTAVLPWQIWNCAVRNTKWLLAANPCYELAEIQWINRVGMSGQIGCATKSAPATT